MFSFQQATSLLLSRFFSIVGRSSRSEFWWSFLAIFMVGNILGSLTPFLLSIAGSIGGLLVSIANLLILIGTFFLVIRRLHDINRSWLWALLLFIPVIGFLILICFTAQPSFAYANKHGLNPNSDLEGHFIYYKNSNFNRYGPYMGQQYRDYSNYQGNGVFGDQHDSFTQSFGKTFNNWFGQGDNSNQDPFKDGFGPNPFKDGFGNNQFRDNQANSQQGTSRSNR